MHIIFFLLVILRNEDQKSVKKLYVISKISIQIVKVVLKWTMQNVCMDLREVLVMRSGS